jgi:hypothetical protein
LEPGPLCLLGRPREQLAEVGRGRRKLAVGRQRNLVDIGFRARDRVVIEVCEPGGHRVDFGVELVVGDYAVHVSVLLGARSVVIVGDEEDLERAAATDQAGEPGHWIAPGHQADADFELAE